MKILVNIGSFQEGTNTTPYVLYAALNDSGVLMAAYKTATGSSYRYIQASVLADAINQGRATVQSNLSLAQFDNTAIPAGVVAGVFTVDNEPTQSLAFTFTGQAYGALKGDDLPLGFSFQTAAPSGDAPTGQAGLTASISANVNSFINDLTSFNISGLIRNPVFWLVAGIVAWRMGWLRKLGIGGKKRK